MDVDSFRNIVPLFANRSDAGRRLAKALRPYRGKTDTLIAGVPRGGVITAAAVAEELMLPLDVLAIRRLEIEGHPGLAVGAIGPGEIRVLDDDVVRALHITGRAIDLEVHRQSAELRRQERLYRRDRLPLEFAGQTVIIVDDGIGSGATMDAALAVARRHHAARIVVAVPVAPPMELERLRDQADEFICLEAPGPFFGIGYWYREFPTVQELDVVRILDRMRLSQRGTPARTDRPEGVRHEYVSQTR